MKILIACEFSGIVREAFAKRGHDAWSCDLLPTEIPGQHIQGDIRGVLYNENRGYPRSWEWDLMIAFPPCTRLCNSGVRWLRERKLWREMEEAAYFFKFIWAADIPHICIENPIPHGYAINIIGRSYDQIIHPWMFGHGETKATCLWLKNLPKLQPTNIVEGRAHKIHKMPGSKDQAKNRSRTFQGIADAMAEQWSELVA
jgi:hypothetical protein